MIVVVRPCNTFALLHCFSASERLACDLGKVGQSTLLKRCQATLVMQEADIESAAERVQLRAHARETIKAALQRSWPVHVLSVNWSSKLIRATLAGIPCRIANEAESQNSDDWDPASKTVQVHANTLEMQLGVTTGVQAATLLHGQTMCETAMKAVVRELEHSRSDGNHMEKLLA